MFVIVMAPSGFFSKFALSENESVRVEAPNTVGALSPKGTLAHASKASKFTSGSEKVFYAFWKAWIKSPFTF